MKTLYLSFNVVGIYFCTVGFLDHATAWAASASSFFAATMIVIGQRKNKNNANHKKEELNQKQG